MDYRLLGRSGLKVSSLSIGTASFGGDWDWAERLAPWGEEIREFRNEGFYERFPAKGQVERVVRIQRELAKSAGVGKAE